MLGDLKAYLGLWESRKLFALDLFQSSWTGQLQGFSGMGIRTLKGREMGRDCPLELLEEVMGTQ